MFKGFRRWTIDTWVASLKGEILVHFNRALISITLCILYIGNPFIAISVFL